MALRDSWYLNFMGRLSQCRQRDVAIRLRGKLRAVCSYAGADKVPGMIAVQVAVLRHVSRDLDRRPSKTKLIADLMTGDFRGCR